MIEAEQAALAAQRRNFKKDLKSWYKRRLGYEHTLLTAEKAGLVVADEVSDNIRLLDIMLYKAPTLAQEYDLTKTTNIILTTLKRRLNLINEERANLAYEQ